MSYPLIKLFLFLVLFLFCVAAFAGSGVNRGGVGWLMG